MVDRCMTETLAVYIGSTSKVFKKTKFLSWFILTLSEMDPLTTTSMQLHVPQKEQKTDHLAECFQR